MKPTGIAIDDRDHIYVADAGTNMVTLFDTYSGGMPVIRQWGGTGQGIGQIGGPRQMTTDTARAAAVPGGARQRARAVVEAGRQQHPSAGGGVRGHRPAHVQQP